MMLGIGIGITAGVGRGAGEAKPWNQSLPALRAFIAANYDQPNPHNQGAMSSPPTVTATEARPTGLTVEHAYKDGADLAYLGGGDKPYSTIFRRAPEVTAAASGGNVGDGQDSYSWRVTAICDAERVGIGVVGSTLPHRFIVDGQYVDTTGTVTETSSGSNWYELDFGTKASREVAIEFSFVGTFYGFAVAPGDTVTAPAAAKRMIVLGDSLTAGTAATHPGDGFPNVAGDMLGIGDVWSSGVGGGGYVNTNGGTVYKLSEHLFDCNDNGPWDLIVVALGANDLSHSAESVTAEASAALTDLRANNQTAQIIVVGSWDTNAPLAPVANYAAINAGIQAGIPSGLGIYWLDPEGVEYAKSDAVHGTTAGHATLGNWLAEQIKTALGVVIPEPGMGDALLMETGDALLLESGDKILLED